MGYNNRNNNFDSRKGNRGQAQTPARKRNICDTVINESLSKYYADGAKVFLPETGNAYKYAQCFKRIKVHQLRKILNEEKSILNEPNTQAEGFDQIRNRFFAIVPMTAYNTGRMAKKKDVNDPHKDLYRFIKNHINQQTIRNAKDIEMFDKLYTCIIAYHTSLNVMAEEEKQNA